MNCKAREAGCWEAGDGVWRGGLGHGQGEISRKWCIVIIEAIKYFQFA